VALVSSRETAGTYGGETMTGSATGPSAADLRTQAEALDAAAAREAHHERRERRAALLREAGRLRAETAALQRRLPELEEELHYLVDTRLAALLREREALQAESVASVQRRFPDSGQQTVPTTVAAAAALSVSALSAASTYACSAPGSAFAREQQPILVRPRSALDVQRQDRAAPNGEIASTQAARTSAANSGGCFSCLNKTGGEAALLERMHGLLQRATTQRRP
jgi:hypothetical protein